MLILLQMLTNFFDCIWNLLCMRWRYLGCLQKSSKGEKSWHLGHFLFVGLYISLLPFFVVDISSFFENAIELFRMCLMTVILVPIGGFFIYFFWKFNTPNPPLLHASLVHSQPVGTLQTLIDSQRDTCPCSTTCICMPMSMCSRHPHTHSCAPIHPYIHAHIHVFFFAINGWAAWFCFPWLVLVSVLKS